MNKQNLQKLMHNLISIGESETIEFKKNNFNEDKIGKGISALANSANLLEKKKAYLIFGVSDNKEIVGTIFQPNTPKIGNELLEVWLNRMLDPKIDFSIHELVVKNKKIILFEIAPAIIQPIKFKNIVKYPIFQERILNSFVYIDRVSF